MFFTDRTRSLPRLLLILTALTLPVGCSNTAHVKTQAKQQNPVHVIAHRGASGYLPEHTTQALILAFMQGANFIEQDVVSSKDGELLVLHDIHIDTVTNVDAIYPNRHRADGRYYAIDFTLAELKQLRVHERKSANGKMVFSSRYAAKGDFRIATVAEQFEMIATLNDYFGRNVGYYPEIKAPAWHREQGIDISARFVELLNQYKLNNATANIYVQCFDFDEIKRLRNELDLNTKLVQLLAMNSWGESKTNYEYLMTSAGLAELANYVDGVGPWIPMLIDTKTNEISSFTGRLKQSGLLIHPYTFRADSPFEDIHNILLLERLFSDIGVDGIFTDHTDVVVQFLAQQDSQ